MQKLDFDDVFETAGQGSSVLYITFFFLSKSLDSVCLQKSYFFKKSKFQEKWISEKWIPEKYFPMFGSVMKNELENTFQCLVMLWKMNWKIIY